MSGSSASSHAGFSKLKFRYSTLELLNDILSNKNVKLVDLEKKKKMYKSLKS